MFICDMKRLSAVLPGTIIFIMIAGCAVNNNSLNVRDLADCLAVHGVKIEYIRPLEPAMLYADSAMELGISGRQLAAYYFNIDLEAQKKRIAKIKKNKYVFIMGLKFPAIVRGSYVLVDRQSVV